MRARNFECPKKLSEYLHGKRKAQPSSPADMGKEKEELEKVSYGQAVLVGVFRSIAMVPGVSHSAATILGGLLVGLRRKTIVEFSFILAVPTMLAVTGYDLLKNAAAFSIGGIDMVAVGFVVSFVAAIASIKLLLRYIQRHSFSPFGVYRIAVAIVFWVLMLRNAG
jgi:undecaprenyl-diphosphatase